MPSFAGPGETMPSKSVYLAGPEVFLPDAVAVGERKKAICARYGLVGLFPFDNEVVPSGSGAPVDEQIYRGNVMMMREADMAILNLSPFRGPGADPGTCFELGFMTALGKPCLGYTNDPDDYLDRVRREGPVEWDAATGYWRDAKGWSVEHFLNVDSLMIDRAVAMSGHSPLRHDARHDPLGDLEAFEMCVRLAANL